MMAEYGLNTKTGFEAGRPFSSSSSGNTSLDLGFGWSNLLTTKRSLLLSLFALQVPGYLRNETSNEVGDAVIERDTGNGLPLVTLEMGRPLTIRNDATTTTALTMDVRERIRLRRLGQALRNLGDELERDAAARRDGLITATADAGFFSRAPNNAIAENRRRRQR